jgi:hypothetical protein
MKLILTSILALPLMFGSAMSEADAGDRMKKAKSTSAIKIAPLNRAQIGKSVSPRKAKGDDYERGLVGKVTGYSIGKSPNIESQILNLGLTAVTLSKGGGH